MIMEIIIKGTFTKPAFYLILDAIDKIKANDGYVFTKHERKDGPYYIEVDYVLTLMK